MRHDPAIQDNFGHTIAMWCAHARIPIKEWMQHDPNIQGENGLTCAMRFVHDNRNDHVPQWMQHDPTLKDVAGWTIEDYWKEYSTLAPSGTPEWMKC